MIDKTKMSFAEQIKLETKGIKTICPEEAEKERQRRLAVDCRIALELGREITQKEILTSPI